MKRFLVIVLVLLVIFTGLFFMGESLGWLDSSFMEQTFSSLPNSYAGQIWIAFAVIIVLCLDLVLPVPSSIVMALSGKLLGFWAGGVASFVGAISATMLGYMVCYAGGTTVFRRFVRDKDADKVIAWFEKYGIYAIILSRPIPMVTEILSCTSGLYKVPIRQFIFASVLGTLPICFVYSYFGQQGGAGDYWPLVWVSLIIPALGWLVVHFIKRKKRVQDAS
jgi:uncharacterized membrane protein YdjX (TVP38/TMEM64 family)